MNSVFIRVGNIIINREQVTGVEYKKFGEEDAFMMKASSMLIIYTTDGRMHRFVGDEADLWWDLFEGSALAIRD